MKTELIEQASRLIPDVGLLVNAVSQRVRQLARGHPTQVERKPGMRDGDIALLELIEGKIKIVQNVVIPIFP